MEIINKEITDRNWAPIRFKLEIEIRVSGVVTSVDINYVERLWRDGENTKTRINLACFTLKSR